MSNTHRHKAKGKIRLPASDYENNKLHIRAFGINCFHRETTKIRRQTNRAFRAKSKVALQKALNSPDKTSFPKPPRTQGWNSN